MTLDERASRTPAVLLWLHVDAENEDAGLYPAKPNLCVCVCAAVFVHVGIKMSYRFFMSRITPRKMMMKSRMAALDPAIFTV